MLTKATGKAQMTLMLQPKNRSSFASLKRQSALGETIYSVTVYLDPIG